MRRLAALLMVGALVLTLAPAAWSGEDDAALAVVPGSGLAGSTATVEGSEWTNAGLTVEIHWDDWDGPLLATVVTELVGSDPGFSTDITIPANATPGTYTIRACVTGPGYPECDDTTHEFHEGATGSFTVDAPPTTTVATTTTSTTTTTVADATTTTVGDGGFVIPDDLSLFPSLIGSGGIGLFGEYTGPVDGFEPLAPVPRCIPPAGSTIIDFDTEWRGAPPPTSRYPDIALFRQFVEEAPAGSVTPRQALHVDIAEPRSGNYIVATFGPDQRYAGVHVGDVAASGSPIELIALDGSGSFIAADRVPAAAPPADLCMAVISDEANIHVLVLRFDGAADVYADRLFFGTGEFPTTPLQETGTVTFSRPEDGDDLSTAVRQVVLGNIRIPEGLRIDRVTLSAPRFDRSRVDTREIDFGPLWVEDGEQLYVFSTSGLYLPEGETWIAVTATGPGVIATGSITVTGVGARPIQPEEFPGQVDVEPITLEVTQAVRGPVDLIPPGTMIPERDDTVLVRDKKTVVRAFARLVFPDGERYAGGYPINAELIGMRDGRALPGSPLSPTHALVDVHQFDDRADAYHVRKQFTQGSWNFVLPETWTAEGEIDLRLEVNSPVLAGHVAEYPGRDGESNIIGLERVTFRAQPSSNVNVWLVDYYFRCTEDERDGDSDTRRFAMLNSAAGLCRSGDPATTLAPDTVVHSQPTWIDAADAVLKMWEMAPLPGSAPTSLNVYSYVYLEPQDDIPESRAEQPQLSAGSPQTAEMLGKAFRMESIVGADGYETFNILMSHHVRGKAWASPSFFRVTTSLSTTIHEATHTMGGRHTGNKHQEAWWIVRWDGDHGELAETPEDVSAFTTRYMHSLPFFTGDRNPAEAHRHDYLSYGGNRWISWDIWHLVEDAVGSGFGRGDNRTDEHFIEVFSERFDEAPDADEDDDGRIDGIATMTGRLTSEGLRLEPVFVAPGAVFDPDGELEVRILDGAGLQISGSWTRLHFPGDDPANEDVDPSFILPIHLPEGSAEVVFLRDGVEAGRLPVAPAPAAVTNPVGTSGGSELEVTGAGERRIPRGLVDFEWTPDGGTVARYLLEVSRDGRQWFTLADTPDPGVTIDTGALPFQGPGWRMRVQASSGLGVTLSPVTMVDFGENRQAPRILLPLHESVVSSNSLIDLQAAVSTFAMGEEESWVWEVDGTRVAVGPTGMTFAGDPGVRVITLTDPETGLRDGARIFVVVDADEDGMSDDWEESFGLDSLDPSDAGVDVDGDGVPAWQEFAEGSSPDSIDSDGDDYADGVEITMGSDPGDSASIPPGWLDGGAAPLASETYAGSGTDEEDGGGSNTMLIVIVSALGGAALASGTVLWVRRRR